MKLDELKKMAQKLGPVDPSMGKEAMEEHLRNAGIEPGSFYQELEMTSRFVDTHQDVSWSNATLSLHSHSFYEVLYCRNTCGVEYLVGPNRYRLEKGDIVFVPPGVSHRPILPERMPEPYRRDVLWISSEFVEHAGKILETQEDVRPEASAPLRTAGTQWEFLGEMFRNGVREAEEKKPGWDAAVMGNTLLILANLKRAWMGRGIHPTKTENPELLDAITAYIENHYSSHITLAELARQFYVSESTVSHLFKKKLGISVYRYVTQRRLIAAKTLIAEGAVLEDVGRHVGFSEYSAFYRAFRQEFGISPRQYRKMLDSAAEKP